MDIVRLLHERGANLDPLQWNRLARAVVLGTLAEVEKALGTPEDRALRDCWRRTPWMLSLVIGDIEKAKRLLAAGVDREDRGFMDQSAAAVVAKRGSTHLVRWLSGEGFGLEDPDAMEMTPLMLAAAHGHADVVETLLRGGAKLHARHGDRTATYYAKDRATLRVLLDAGADIADTSESMRRVLRCESRTVPSVMTKDFREGKSRRFGRANPEIVTRPFWRYMVASAEHAYNAYRRFGSSDEPPTRGDPVWCFSRFGQSITILPDGSLAEIAGEHEDSYDADFCIYNDVVVHRPDGTFTIYAYPEDVFPPTDFHTATYVDGAIYIVGSLGYLGKRAHGTTPVYRLSCATFAIEQVSTTGEGPGWIHRHRARLDSNEIVVSDGQVVDERDHLVPNADTFALNLRTMRWRKCQDARR